MNPFYLPLFLSGIAVAVLIGVGVYVNRKLARIRLSLAVLARSVQGRITRKSILQGDLFEGRYEGLSFTCRYFMGSKNSPPSLTLAVRVPFPAKLSLRKEAWYDRLASRIGLVAQLKTGDPVFDGAYYLDTDRADIVLPYFSDEAKRRAVDALFQMGNPLQKIVFGKNDIQVVLSPMPEGALQDVALAKYLQELQKLTNDRVPASLAASFDPRLFPGGPPRPLSMTGLAFLFIFNGLCVIGGLLALAFGMSEYEPLGHRLITDALLVSVPAVFLYLLFVFRWIRGRASSHRYYLVILILSVIGFPLAAAGGAVATNGIFDQGDETPHRAAVAGLYYHQNKNSRTYYVAFPSWQHPGQTDSLAVPHNLYRTLRLSGEVIIRTKPGYWREEWIVGIEPAAVTGGAPGAQSGLPLIPGRIRFYECGTAPVPPEQKRFAAEFTGASSRYICCQVDMENDFWNIRDQSYTFSWRYLNPDGSLLGEVSMPFTVRKNWHRAWVVHSWGWKDPGNWPVGSYRVIVLVNGLPFGAGSFVIR